jgi:hypothetical protein
MRNESDPGLKKIKGVLCSMLLDGRSVQSLSYLAGSKATVKRMSAPGSALFTQILRDASVVDM